MEYGGQSLPRYEVPEWEDYECNANGSCCHGWVVPVDDEHQSMIEDALQDHPHPEWGKEMPLEKEDSQFLVMDSGHCPYLTDDGLCWLHKELGPEVKPEICKTFPRRELKTPLGVFKSLQFSCVTSTRMLTDEQYQLFPGEYEVPEQHDGVKPFQLEHGVSLHPETYVMLENTVFRILERDHGTLDSRLAAVGKYVNIISRHLDRSDKRKKRINKRFLEGELPDAEFSAESHARIIQPILDYRKSFKGKLKQTNSHKQLEQFIARIQTLLPDGESKEYGGRNNLASLKAELWDQKINQFDHILTAYLKRLIWSKFFTYNNSFTGGIKIVSTIYALVRLHCLSYAVENQSELKKWHVLNGIVNVERLFTHSNPTSVLWSKILDNPELSKDWFVPLMSDF